MGLTTGDTLTVHGTGARLVDDPDDRPPAPLTAAQLARVPEWLLSRGTPTGHPDPDETTARTRTAGRASAEVRTAGPAEDAKVFLQVVAADGSHQP
eukprot:7520638-Alexandrium_andersonii.AAC.1